MSKTKCQIESNKAFAKGKCVVCQERQPKKSPYPYTCGVGCQYKKNANPFIFPDPIF